MRNFITFIAALLLSINCLLAQNAHFVTSGTIIYQKSVNMFALIKKEINKDNEDFLQSLYDQYVKNQPQFKRLSSSLNFVSDKTLFTPVEDENGNNGFFGNNAMVSQNNTIATDLQSGTFTAQKKVYDETFILKDTTRKIKWKITDETREIAGYTCRRANALVLDSIYVVAFYTEQIPVSGGPESFTGLPGMILGVALPHENITWFATKVTEGSVDDKALLPPKKGKPVNNAQFQETLKVAMKDWGTWKNMYLKAFSL